MIIDLICKNWPELTFTAVTCVLVWSYARFYFWTHNACNDIPEMKTDIGEIKITLNKLNAVLLEKSVISRSCFSQENSPRVMNDEGKELYRESGAAELFNNRWPLWKQELDKKKYDSKLELERECLILLINKSDNPEFRNLQSFAYEHPTYKEKPLTYTDILFVMSLKLRDNYLKKCPKLK